MGPQRFPDGIERRCATELRTAGRQLVGYAARFGTPAKIGGFTETIRAGAFRASLATPGRDVTALVDHSPDRLLGRTSSGTLRLNEDARGLAFVISVPDTTLGHDILALAERGDLGGCSFGFRVAQDAWPAKDQRELLAVDLIEISVITGGFPAYDSTSVSARSLGRHEAGAYLRRLRLAVL